MKRDILYILTIIALSIACAIGFYPKPAFNTSVLTNQIQRQQDSLRILHWQINRQHQLVQLLTLKDSIRDSIEASLLAENRSLTAEQHRLQLIGRVIPQSADDYQCFDSFQVAYINAALLHDSITTVDLNRCKELQLQTIKELYFTSSALNTCETINTIQDSLNTALYTQLQQAGSDIAKLTTSKRKWRNRTFILSAYVLVRESYLKLIR